MSHIRVPAAVFAIVTILFRIVRIRNVVADAGLDTAARIGWLALAGVMIGLAAVVLWGAVSRIHEQINASNRRIWVGSLYALAAITVIVWVEQVISIVSEWRSVGFVVVHLVLAVISIGLASWAVRDVRASEIGRASCRERV